MSALTHRPAITLLPRILLLVLALTVGLLVAPAPASATTSAESTFVKRVNSARQAKGLSALTANVQLATVARGWSQTMASRSNLEHRPGLGTEVSRSVTDDWTRVGENVGYTTNGSKAGETTLVDRIHTAFMNSSGHKANILGDYNQVGVGVVVSGNGTMWVTVNFMQAPVSGAAQTQPVSSVPRFGSWAQHGVGGNVSAPGAVSWADGRRDLFIIDGNGALRQRYSNGGAWAPSTTWTNLGRPSRVKLVGAPAVASQGTRSLDVFARGSDNAVWHRYFRPSSGWSGWTSMGGVITDSPSAVSWGQGHVAVFGRSPNTDVYYRDFVRGRGWIPWSAIGGKVSSSPSVASWSPGRYDVFARGASGQLVHAWQTNGRWSGWESLGGVLSGAGRPDAISWGPRRLDVFVNGTTGLVHRKSFDGSGWDAAFTALSPITGGFTSGTAVLSQRPGHLQVFGRGADGHAWEASTP